MKILIAPLNWGLGHASRSLALFNRLSAEGHEVVVAGNGESLSLMLQHLPKGQRYVRLSNMQLHYSSSSSQMTTLIRQIPMVLKASLADRRMLRQLLEIEHFDMIISDNRFFFRNKHVHSVYLTHQLHIIMPQRWRWLEGIANAVNRWMIGRYNECWVPDYQDLALSLAGMLSHPKRLPATQVKYIGPLSRFERTDADMAAKSLHRIDGTFDVVAVLSGLEPQRSIFENDIVSRYLHTPTKVLVVRGKVGQPPIITKKDNLSLVSYLDDKSLREVIMEAKEIIARSGYSTLMDLEVLGAIDKANFTATPGQSEQEYLLSHIKSRSPRQRD